MGTCDSPRPTGLIAHKLSSTAPICSGFSVMKASGGNLVSEPRRRSSRGEYRKWNSARRNRVIVANSCFISLYATLLANSALCGRQGSA